MKRKLLVAVPLHLFQHNEAQNLAGRQPRTTLVRCNTASQKIAGVCLTLLEKEPSRERSYV